MSDEMHEPHPASTCDAFPLAVALTQAKPDLDMAELLDQAANRIAAEGAINDGLRKALHEIYWEAMNLGTTHKWLASNDGEIDEYSPSYTVSQVLHEFARKVIKTAAQQHGVELYK